MIRLPNFTDDETKTYEVKWLGASHCLSESDFCLGVSEREGLGWGVTPIHKPSAVPERRKG